MKRLFILIYLIFFGLALSFAQSERVIDDIYITPNEAKMLQAVKQAKIEKLEALRKQATHKNGAREIVFIDENGNSTQQVPDTVFIIGDTLKNQSEYTESGHYLNGFKGSQSDYEYAERIRRFHNPKYTITITDPGYNDIYFLDDNYWNVYIDGMYATITPTWNNPYSWNYLYSPYSYNSGAWRYNYGYPYNNWGWSGYSSPWLSWGWSSWYGGWHNSWYNPYGSFGGYYGWGGYPYYGYGGGYYGWDYPYYGYGYSYYGNWEDSYSRENRRGTSRSVYNTATTVNRSNLNSRESALNTSHGNYTTVSRQRNPNNTQGRITNINSSNSRAIGNERTSRASYPNIDTRSRTGAVRSTNQWNATRNAYNNTRSSASTNRSSSVMTNRTNPTQTSRNRRTYDSRSSNNNRTYDRSSNRSYSNRNSTRSSRNSNYSLRNSNSTSSSRSSSTYSSGSTSRSSSSYSGGSRSSSSSGGGRSSGGRR